MRGYRTTDGPGLRIVVAERRLRQPRSPSVVPAFRWTRGLAVHDVVDLFAIDRLVLHQSVGHGMAYPLNSSSRNTRIAARVLKPVYAGDAAILNKGSNSLNKGPNFFVYLYPLENACRTFR